MISMIIAYALIAIVLVAYGASVVQRTRQVQRALHNLNEDKKA